jgi:hypothetical protein
LLKKDRSVIIVVGLKKDAYLKIKQYHQHLNHEKLNALKINRSKLWYQQKKIKEGKIIKMYNKSKVRIE